MQWIAYFTFDENDPVPVATGSSRAEAVSSAVERTLCKGVGDGLLMCVQRDDVSAEDFAALKEILEKNFTGGEHGME
jgi:hypothetical protein